MDIWQFQTNKYFQPLCIIFYFKELLEKIKEFSQLKELRKVDSCFIFISSHGNTNTEYEVTEIQGVDYNPDSKDCNYKTVLCTDILNNFTAEACPHLAGKPKIFIFQLCRQVF